MTEQEAEVWAARLTRVWEPAGRFIITRNKVRTYFLAPLKEGVRMEQAIYPDEASCYWLTHGKKHHEFMSFYASRNSIGELNLDFANADDEERIGVLQDQWLFFFRRNCWLCGCPIEASAHEKAEWIQGLSCEEIEAWDLKL